MRQFSYRSIISKVVEMDTRFFWLSACLWRVATDDSVTSTAMSLHVPVWLSARINDSNSSRNNGLQARADAVETQVRCSERRGATVLVRGSDAQTRVFAPFFFTAPFFSRLGKYPLSLALMTAMLLFFV